MCINRRDNKIFFYNVIYYNLFLHKVNTILEKTITLILKLININFECGEDESFNKKGYGLYIGNDDFGVCIYFNKKGLSDAYYGVYANNDNLFNNMTKIFHDFIIENNFDEPFDVFLCLNG